MDERAKELRDALLTEGKKWTKLRRELNEIRSEGRNPRASALRREVKAQHGRLKDAMRKLLDAGLIES